MSAKEVVAEQRAFFKTNATRSLEFRKEQLQKLKKMIGDNADALCQCIYKDLRRDPKVNMEFEVKGSITTIDFCLAHLTEWTTPNKLPSHQLGQPILQYEPKGVVLVITAWNYPVSLAFQPMVEAIVAGNTVVLKPSEISPNTSNLLKKLLDANFDKKFIATFEGGPEETANLLEERFDHIFYTGSSNIGKIVMQEAAKHLTPVTLELGGKCPVFVESDADVEKTAQRIAEGKWLNSGQTCVAPDYVMTSSVMKPKLVDGLQKVIKVMYGDKIQGSENYSRIVNQRHFDRVKALLESTHGKILFKGGEMDRNDVFIPPIIVDAPLKDRLMEEEVFGPVLPIVTVKDLDEAIGVINDGEKPLAAYLFTKDHTKMDKFLSQTSSGGVTINDILKHTFVSDLPFGGVGTSGMGAYHGKQGFIEMSHAKSILVRGD